MKRIDLYQHTPAKKTFIHNSWTYFITPTILIIIIILLVQQIDIPTPIPYQHCPRSKYFDPETTPMLKTDTLPDPTSEGIIDIQWTHFTEYPRGNQDSAGTIYKHQLFSTGGFCGGNYFPYYCQPRDFFTDTYLYSFVSHTWNQVQNMPGLGRQGHKCENINDQVYCIGGFSYTEPYSHTDSYKYNGTWHRIADAPTRHVAAAQICTMNDKIYLLESADYDLQQFHMNDQLFVYDTNTDTWEQINNLPGTPRWTTDITCIQESNEIYVLGGASGNYQKYVERLCKESIPHKNDIPKSNNRDFQIKSWNVGCENNKPTLDECKNACNSGCCGINCASNSCGGGGCCAASEEICDLACEFVFTQDYNSQTEDFDTETNSNNQTIYKTIIDNWKYNTQTDTWTRLTDTPLVIGNWMFQLPYEGFIFLIGGAGYAKIANNTQVQIPTNRNVPHSDSNRNVANDYLFTNNVYAYNIQNDAFIHVTPLPYDWNGPTAWLKDGVIYLSAGELGIICTEEDFFPRHPKMTLQGKITIKKPHP